MALNVTNKDERQGTKRQAFKQCKRTTASQSPMLSCRYIRNNYPVTIIILSLSKDCRFAIDKTLSLLIYYCHENI
ncbi:MAG: hypothetical protein HQK99_02690 [Nitrospirae bacterium]|nr:hypothetical protein [Nitrospirota bacterium]